MKLNFKSILVLYFLILGFSPSCVSPSRLDISNVYGRANIEKKCIDCLKRYINKKHYKTYINYFGDTLRVEYIYILNLFL